MKYQKNTAIETRAKDTTGTSTQALETAERNDMEQLDRWREHFNELLWYTSQCITVHQRARIPGGEFRGHIIPEEIINAIEKTKSGKSKVPGIILPEAHKTETSVTVVILMGLFQETWETEE